MRIRRISDVDMEAVDEDDFFADDDFGVRGRFADRSDVTTILVDTFEEIIEFYLQKTNGELGMYIRRDDNIAGGGLYVHGFRHGSRAKSQGIIQVGDELMEMNHVSIEGKNLTDIVAALAAKSSDNDDIDSYERVHVKIRHRYRFKDMEDDDEYESDEDSEYETDGDEDALSEASDLTEEAEDD